MKRFILFTSLFLTSAFFQRCQENEGPAATGKVQFSFRSNVSNNPGGRSLSELPDGSVLFISYVYTNGVPANYLKEVTLLKFGDEFISEPVLISEGEYKITDFIITDANHRVTFATPRENSPLASSVDTALPNIIFSVTENEITNLTVQVIALAGHSPEDFGYTDFYIEPIPQEGFELSVFSSGENGELQYTSVQAYILLGDDTIYNQYLAPAITSIVFENNPDDFYTLVLIESSYKKYSRTFRINDLLEELNGSPLAIILEPAFTFTTSSHPIEQTPHIIQLNIATNPTTLGELYVDWGDGQTDVIELPFTGLPLEHLYESHRPRFVSVSGKLEAIERFIHFGGFTITAISVRNLPNLKEFGLGFCPAITEIDVTHNTKLQTLSLIELSIETLDISQNPYIRTLGVDVLPHFTQAAIDDVIHTLLRHVDEHHLYDGSLHIANDWSAQSLTGPPSATGLSELQELRDHFRWYIFPENF